MGMEMLRDAVQSTGRGLHIHVAEDRYDVSHSHDVYGQDLIERLAAHRLINDKTLVAHGLYLSDADIEHPQCAATPSWCTTPAPT